MAPEWSRLKSYAKAIRSNPSWEMYLTHYEPGKIPEEYQVILNSIV